MPDQLCPTCHSNMRRDPYPPSDTPPDHLVFICDVCGCAVERAPDGTLRELLVNQIMVH